MGACRKGEESRREGALPGMLSKSIDAYSGDEFDALVKRLDFVGGHERERMCRNNPGCAGTKRIKVRVDAVATQDSLVPATVPVHGVVYVRALNHGDADEARYGMAAGAQYQYYVIVTADTAGGMRWRLEQLDTTPGARRHTRVGEGRFVSCNHKWVAGARADFKSCTVAAAEHDSSVAPRALALEDDPFWVSCGGGCCNGEP